MIQTTVYFLLVFHFLTLSLSAESSNISRYLPGYLPYAETSKPLNFDISELSQKFPNGDVSLDFLDIFEKFIVNNSAVCLKNQCCLDLIGAFRPNNHQSEKNAQSEKNQVQISSRRHILVFGVLNFGKTKNL